MSVKLLTLLSSSIIDGTNAVVGPRLFDLLLRVLLHQYFAYSLGYLAVLPVFRFVCVDLCRRCQNIN